MIVLPESRAEPSSASSRLQAEQKSEGFQAHQWDETSHPTKMNTYGIIPSIVECSLAREKAMEGWLCQASLAATLTP
jgi:hypothetical protein